MTTQHPKAAAKGITPGDITTHEMIAKYYTGSNGAWMTVGDIGVMADALNTCNRTGRTPSELADMVRELRAALMLFEGQHDYNECFGTAETAIAETKDFV